ncbi:hypothetical protein FQA39_LY19018 [Lamprigera yunnana]|nr:hypothetical protein FQA39_LY19018 [Lamprigera yunnana]
MHPPDISKKDALQLKRQMITAAFSTNDDIKTIFVRNSARYRQGQWLRRVGSDSISVFGRVRRTNNDAESFHASLTRILRIRGPNIWKFTDCLRKITATTIREVSAFVDRGLQVRALGKRKYSLNDRRIQRAVDYLNVSENVLVFLEIVCSTTQAILDWNLLDNEPSFNNKEQLLVSLDGNVPRKYEIVGMSLVNQREEEGRLENETEASENIGELNDNVRARQQSGELSEDALCIVCKEVPPTSLASVRTFWFMRSVYHKNAGTKE